MIGRSPWDEVWAGQLDLEQKTGNNEIREERRGRHEGDG